MRKPKITPYTSLAAFPCGDDAAGNLACFLLEHTGSIWGRWKGRLTAADQRRLFGRFVGKGTLAIDGSDETITHIISVCFGTMYAADATYPWRDLVIEGERRDVA